MLSPSQHKSGPRVSRGQTQSLQYHFSYWRSAVEIGLRARARSLDSRLIPLPISFVRQIHFAAWESPQFRALPAPVSIGPLSPFVFRCDFLKELIP
jgi:hypothetical protein